MTQKACKRLIIGLLIFVLAVIGAGCKKQAPKTTAAPQKALIKPVVEAFGIVKARDYKDINLDFPAQITAVPVKDGQHVKQGEALVYLNTSNFQAYIKSKENELNQARFELLRIQKNLRDAEEVYERAKQQLAGKEKLFRDGAISALEMDDFRDQVKDKEKAVTDIKLSLGYSTGVTGIEVQTEKVAVLEYDLKRMKDKLNQSFLQGNVIIADYPKAVVYDVNCAAGYSVGGTESTTGQQKLLSIMNLNSLYISADVPEEFIKDVQIGSPVTIIPVADNSRKYQGKIIRIADMAVQKNGETNIPVEISIEGQDGFLRPNFNVDVEIAK
jgi:HlyD family secretion protein